ncbi:MAG TPA: NAD(P)H-dependent oxidoreductase subunit E [Acidimicrobiales bacterium]|nr:NAD(P)H-dependent oxidoreductase subunit E [Acidimicrobiales bacterium]
MARLRPDNEEQARELIALYPQRRSALIPILHLLQEQDGYLTPDGMAHVGELLGLAPAEVMGTASFYDMLHTEPVGHYLLAVCTNIACMLAGAFELLEHAEKRLGISPGGTTADGMFTLEDAECLALCGNAPCLTANWRFFGDVNEAKFDSIVDHLAGGRLADQVPPHGTLNRVRREVGLLASGATVHPSAPGGALAADGVAPARAEVAAGTAPATGAVSGMAQGSREQGSEAQGSEAQGSEAQGSTAKVSKRKGSRTKGPKARGATKQDGEERQ